MIVVKCPQCDDPVSLPVGVDRHARVMCPLCGAQFDLAVVLERLPPALVILESGGGAFAAGADIASGASVYPGLDEEDQPAFADAFVEVERGQQDELRLAAPQPMGARPGSELNLGGATKAVGKGAAKGNSVASRRLARSQRNQKSAIAEMIKVVGGGVLGLTIGQLVLWWLPGEWKRDPFQLGPVITKSVPWLGPKLVPAKFRGSALARRSPAAEPPTSFQFEASPPATTFGGSPMGSLPDSEFAPGLVGNNAPAASGRGGRARNDQPLSSTPATDDSAGLDLFSSSVPGADNGASSSAAEMPLEPANPQPGQDDLVVPMIDLSAFPGASPAQPKPASPEVDAPTIAAPTIPAPDTPPIEPTSAAVTQPGSAPSAPTADVAAVSDLPVRPDLGLKGVPRVAPDGIADQMALAAAAVDKLDTLTGAAPAERLQAVRDFYASFAKLGENLAHAEALAEGADFQRKAVRDLLLRIGADTNKHRFVTAAFQSWMSNPRPHAGVFVMGTVEVVESREPYVAVRLQLPREERITVISPRALTAKLTPNAKVFVLGTLVEDPSIQLQDYAGQNERVILEGLIQTAEGGEAAADKPTEPPTQ